MPEKSPASLGEFEQLVLLALLRLDPEGYGVSVQQEIASRTGRAVTLGAVYKGLLRLEQKGFIGAWVGEPTAERGGRRKKHYRLTQPGRRALSASLEALRSMSRGIMPLPEPR